MRVFAILLAAVLVGACGAPGITAASATTAAVGARDVPRGMLRCAASGDIDTFLKTLSKKDPGSFAKNKAQWDAAKKAGAIAAEVAIYSDTKADCDAVSVSTSTQKVPPGTRVLVSYSFQFKDAATAVKAYGDQSIWGIGAANTPSGGFGTLAGTGTGLGKNSVAVGLEVGGHGFYVAFWQNKAFVLILLAINVAQDQAKQVAVSENTRIDKF